MSIFNQPTQPPRDHTPAATEKPAPAGAGLAPPVVPRTPLAPPDRGTAPHAPHKHLVGLMTTNSFAADQYRALRHAVELACAKQGARVLAVTSPVSGDGKTLTSLNLAGTLAQSRQARVLVVDADLRRPSVAEFLGMEPGPGLADAVRDPRLTLEALAVRLDRYNVSVVSARPVEGGTYELLTSPRMGQLLREARQAYDYVIVDTPPLVPVPDTRLISPWVDGFLVVIGANRTPRQLLDEALSLVDRNRIIGLVFNGATEPHAQYRRYFGGYYVGTPHRGAHA